MKPARRRIDPFWWFAIFVLVARATAAPFGLGIYLAIALYGLGSSRRTLEALLLSWLVSLGNPALFGEIPAAAIGRYIVFAILAVAAILSDKRRRPAGDRLVGRPSNKIVGSTIAIGIFVAGHSYFFSDYPTISIMKGILWSGTAATAFYAAARLDKDEADKLEEHMFKALTITVILSLIAWRLTGQASMPGYGYARGILGHSQALGVVGGMIAVWSFARTVQMRTRKFINLAPIALGLFAAFAASARIGVFSALGVIVIMTVISPRFGPKTFYAAVGRVRTLAMLALLGSSLAFLLLGSDRLDGVLTAFLSKNSNSVSVTSAYSESRGGLISDMLDNVYEHPFTGIGFGIASEPRSMVVETFSGIPIGAPVEKGVTPVAILEELGIFGAALVSYWFAILLLGALGTSFLKTALILCISLQNMGEASLFSVSGVGLLSVVVLAYCASKPSARHRKAKFTAFPAPA